MNTKPVLKIALIVGVLIVLSSALIFADSVVKLSTYYPAPYGAYDRLKLVPRETLPLDPNCDDVKDLGTMYYDDGSGELPEGVHICQRISEDQMTWVPMGQRYY